MATMKEGMRKLGVQLVRQGLLLQEDWLAVVGVAPPRAGYFLLPPRMLLSRLCDSCSWRPHGGQKEEEEKVESPRWFRVRFFLVFRRVRCASRRLLRQWIRYWQQEEQEFVCYYFYYYCCCAVVFLWLLLMLLLLLLLLSLLLLVLLK